jgi:hypothetical protein
MSRYTFDVDEVEARQANVARCDWVAITLHSTANLCVCVCVCVCV